MPKLKVKMPNTKSDPNANHRRWVIMACQCGLTGCDGCPTVLRDVDKWGRLHMCAHHEIWKLFIFQSVLL